MASHQLIDAYLATLARRLPADAVDELADGLAETYQRYRSAGLSPDTAATATINEFGAPELVTAAFVRQAPGRRIALILLGTGPIIGACWAVALVTAHAWTWPIPWGPRTAFGVTLLAVVATLALAATGRRSYRRTRLAVGAGLAMVGLDGAMLAALILAAPRFAWPMVPAVLASLTRMALTVRAVPRLGVTSGGTR